MSVFSLKIIWHDKQVQTLGTGMVKKIIVKRLIFSEATEVSPMNGGDDSAQGFLLSALFPSGPSDLCQKP
jgi:hypothetical protein